MLSELTIENVAVIEKAVISFTSGFNVLTGETGAGKSILIDSINAILGNRTSRELVRTGAEKSTIWAKFNQISENTKQALREAGYSDDDELLLFREISAEGKSTCRINGSPATAAIVREICDGLVDIYGQHDSADLINPARHLKMLDNYAQNENLHKEYYTVYKELCSVQRQIKSLVLLEKDKETRVELLQFNINEIRDASLVSGEEESLIIDREKARNSASIMSSLQNCYSSLSGADDDEGIVMGLSAAARFISQISELSPQYSDFEEKLNDLYYNAKDLAEEINRTFTDFEDETLPISQIEERLDIIYKLKLKYGANIDEILQELDKQEQELNEIQMSDEKLELLRIEQKKLFSKAKQLADDLTKSRLSAFERMRAEITKTLEFLNMANINFVLNHTTGPLAGSGQDSVEFYLSANKGEESKPLSKIASGGELSRIMLAIKSSIAEKDNIAVQIYDEIDTGVSGLASGRIGKKLRETSEGCQIICITHTAQIASYASTHLLIEKTVNNERTFTKVKQLNKDERVLELARIMQGDNITELALAGAEEMLRSNSNA